MKKQPIHPTDIPLLIFGGKPDDGIDIGLDSAFERAFDFDCNVAIWGTIGINPFNRDCLNDSKVKHEIVQLLDRRIDVNADPLSMKLL